VKPYRLLISLGVACLLLVSARDSHGAIQGQVPDPAHPRVLVQPNAALIPVYHLYHPRFYKEYGDLGLSSTLYVQNPNEMPATYSFDFFDCTSGTLVTTSTTWQIPPRGTRVAGPGDFTDLAPGCYGLVISTDQPLAPFASVVEDTWSAGPAVDKLATHTGFAEAASNLRFGPFLKGDVNSTVVIWNVNYISDSTVTATAYGASGSQIDLPSCTISPYAQCIFDASALENLPEAFTGVLVIHSTGGADVGIMALDSTSGDFNEYRKPLEAGASVACVPRVLKHVNEGGVARSTAIFVANSTSQAADANLVFYGSDGAPFTAADQSFTLAANGSRYLELAELAGIPDGTWSVCASGDRPLAMEELTHEDSLSAYLTSSATHGVTRLGLGNTFAVTHLMRSDASYTAFSVQNTGITTADIDIKYYDVSGALLHTDSVSLAPMGWARFNQSTQSGLENGFLGSQVISSNQSLVSLVDEYVPPPLVRIYLPFALR
jgi:hypothetical protein